MASTAPTITIIGSLNTDLVTYTPRLPQGGETLTASSFHVGLGGKGANLAEMTNLGLLHFLGLEIW